MRTHRAALGVVLIFLGAISLVRFSALPAAAQELRLHVSADTVTVGERFYVSITAEHEFAQDPAFPDPTGIDSMVFGDLEVLNRHARNRTARDGVRIDSIVYEVTTFALDTARVGPIPVLFTAAEDTFTVYTDASLLPVASLVPEDAEGLRDLAPLVEFPSSRWIYAAAAALLLLAAIIAFLVWRRRMRRDDRAPAPPPKPAVPPDVEALQRLKALEEVDLNPRDAARPFYIELSETMRTYVSRRLQVHALEQTTSELIDELRSRQIPNAEVTSRLRNLLVQSDYVKFADAVPPARQGLEAIETARGIIRSVESELHVRVADEETPEPDARPTGLDGG